MKILDRLARNGMAQKESSDDEFIRAVLVAKNCNEGTAKMVKMVLESRFPDLRETPQSCNFDSSTIGELMRLLSAGTENSDGDW